MTVRITSLLATVLGLISVFTDPASAQDTEIDTKCGCTEYPFKPQPPCYDQCVARYLSSSDIAELKANLGISPELEELIFNFQSSVESNIKQSSYAQFQEQFNYEDLLSIRNALDEADQQWLEQDLQEKFGAH